MSGIGSPDPSSSGVEGLRSASMTRDRRLAHLAGVLGIVGQLASAYWYLLYPLLVVPSPASYLFFAAWFVLVGLTVAWWRHHPVRSFFVPIVSVPAVVFALWIGTTFLGWAP
jgi:hypothetical protein